jgi:PAS domain S-box-containing protein
MRTIEQALATDETQIYEYEVPIADELRYFEARIVPYGTDKVLSIIREITERKRAEMQLQDSERRYRLLADNSADLIWTCGTREETLAMRYINPAVEKMLGYTVEEFLHLPLEERMTSASLKVMDDVIAEIERTGEPRRFQIQHRHKSGRCVDCELWTKPITDDKGRITGFQGRTIDITERRRAEAERARLTAQIHDQAQQLEQILATVPAGVMLLNSEVRVLQANPVAENALALLAEAGVGDVITHLGDRSLSELLASPPTQGLWHEVQGESRTFEAIARPVERGAEPGHWVLVINDVTQEREIRTQLRQQERLAAVGQLAAGIAHDFNNIMTSIVLYARMTEQSPGLSARDRDRLAVVNQQAWHASRLIEQILDFSRRAVLERRPLDLLLLAKEQVKLLERTLPENIEIELTCEPEETYVVNADPTRMQQILTNLAVNARDAMPKGGTLRIRLEQIALASDAPPILPGMDAGVWVKLSVADSGTGIAPEVLPHIFEPFFTTKGPGGGSGLGLPQVYGIVKKHAGHIDVATEVGEGTTFTIYLPALAGRHPETPPESTQAFAAGEGETLLVVEDNITLRRALVDSLTSLNYEVLEAGNGHEALEVLAQHADEISLVLSDLVMPEMGGQGLFYAMRKRDVTIPIVILSGHPMEKELEKLQCEGLAGWMLKPPNMEQLSQLLMRVLKQDREY